MFICIYKKSDNIVHQVRNDTSVPQLVSAEQHLLNFCSDSGASVNEYAVVEILNENIEFCFGKFVYDTQNNSMAISPRWVKPLAVETSIIPVSDPAAVQ